MLLSVTDSWKYRFFVVEHAWASITHPPVVCQPLVGDQSDTETLHNWIRDSGGSFDVIIDDGGHTNMQMVFDSMTCTDCQILDPSHISYMQHSSWN
jgi:hypothetical protein